MGKREKAHRKKVAARNRKIEQQRKAFDSKFRELLLKEIEAEKQRRAEGIENNVEPKQEEGNVEQG